MNVAIDTLNILKEISSITPANAILVRFASSRLRFGYVSSYSVTASFQFTFYKDTEANEQDYVEFGLFCTDICKSPDRGLNGK